MLPLMDDPRWGPYFQQRDAEARGDQIADRNLARNYHVGLGTPEPVQRTLVFFPSPEPPPDPPPVAPRTNLIMVCLSGEAPRMSSTMVL